jgi:hypothetical protein
MVLTITGNYFIFAIDNNYQLEAYETDREKDNRRIEKA